MVLDVEFGVGLGLYLVNPGVILVYDRRVVYYPWE